MPFFTKLLNRNLLLLLFGLGILFGAVKFCSKKKNNDFPKLTNGTFNGNLKLGKKNFPFFLKTSKDSAIIAVISPGNVPRKVSTQPRLEFNFDGQNYTLVGEKLNQEYRGEVLKDSKLLGTWQLARIKNKSEEIANLAGLDLEIKKYYLSKSEALKLRNEVKQLASLQVKYQNAFSNQDQIKTAVASQVEDLKYNIEDKQNSRKVTIKDIRAKITDLEQLLRISPLGRVIDLARRTTKREDRWYLANWGDEVSVESNQQIADSLGIDLSKIDEKLKLADEYINLKNSISAEARKIEQLRYQPVETETPVTRPLPTPQIQREKKSKSLIEKIGDIFDL